jgi:hypothetical protein
MGDCDEKSRVVKKKEGRYSPLRERDFSNPGQERGRGVQFK